MHEHVNKRVKMQRKPASGTNKHGKHIIAQSGKGEKYAQANNIMVMHPKCLHPNKASWASDVTAQP